MTASGNGKFIAEEKNFSKWTTIYKLLSHVTRHPFDAKSL